MFVIDDLTPYKASPLDNAETLKGDLAFIQDLTSRCNGKQPRVWVHKDEIKQLRRIAGLGGSKIKNKNRRIRVITMRGYLAKAEDKLAERAAALTTVALGVEN